MGQNHCELTEDGKKARDQLLELLYPRTSYTDSLLHRDTGVDRGQTIPKILGKKAGGIQQVKLEQFFERLLRLLRGKIEDKALAEEAVNGYLRKHGLKRVYDQIWKGDSAFYLPKLFYDYGVKTKIIKNENSKRQIESNKKHFKNVIDLFWHLDYKHQEREFEDALATKGYCIAFSISAPCETTQRWITNRLIRKIENRENALLLPTMSLKEHSMRANFQNFWVDLSQHFGTQASKTEVLKSLCQGSVDRPVILTIRGQVGHTQKNIMQEFWEPLAVEVAKNSKRSERSRIVLFFVDQCCPKYESSHLIKLDPLDEIPEKDVKSWLNSDPVAQWWQPKFGDEFVQGLIEHEFPKEEWDWADPWVVLDKVCFKLELEHGILDVEEAWKWAS